MRWEGKKKRGVGKGELNRKERKEMKEEDVFFAYNLSASSTPKPAMEKRKGGREKR